jgi:hypothetical protein
VKRVGRNISLQSGIAQDVVFLDENGDYAPFASATAYILIMRIEDEDGNEVNLNPVKAADKFTVTPFLDGTIVEWKAEEKV